MLKKTIKYEDFDGEEHEDIFYFNLSKPEIVELDVEHEGFGKMLERIVEEKDIQKVLEYFKKIISLTYGVKSADGKRFIKNAQVVEEFMQTPAYEALYMQLLTDEAAAAAFMQGVMPADMQAQAEEIQKAELAKAKAEAEAKMAGLEAAKQADSA